MLHRPIEFTPEFGQTARQIEQAGLRIDETVECLLSSDSDVGMAKTIGVATLGLADVLGRMRPDLLLLIADRYELLAPAAVALALRIPIAHIEGGDISEGAIDDAVRNALTKMSHIHFTPTAAARQRVLALGEEAWRVHHVGAPSLDHLRHSALLNRTELERELGQDLGPSYVVVAYHPVTLLRDTIGEADAVFSALSEIDRRIVFCFPNADAGSRELIARARAFCDQRADAYLYTNLDSIKYWSLLKGAGLMLGNSSSGIMETPSLALPTVNIGIRQQGRERAANHVDCRADTSAILRAVEQASSDAFRGSLRGMSNPYGDGQAGERISAVLAGAPPGNELLMKKSVTGDARDQPTISKQAY